jgi:myo-inositol 2-dehydrogenase / D-chiro-inositol 1-dehydrogenase
VSAAPLRAGIIGLGWIARVHVPALDAAADIELVAACDTDSERAEAIARPRGARAYTSWEEMLNREDLDALWVCTPPLRHRDPALAALASGIHVYLEKPIARTLDDAEAIVSAARSADAVCAVGYQWHASELIEKAREALAGQRVALLLGRNYGPVAGRPWFMDRAQGGGQILERGSHHIDLQRAIAGEISAVQAVAAREQLAQSDSEGSIDDAIGLVLHFESGALGSVYSAWSREGQPELYTTDILATDATITLEFGPDAFRISGLSRSRSLAGEFGDPMKRSFARFLEAARTGDAGLVFCSPQDALRTLAVALACERALEDGGRIEVWS